MRSNFGGLDFVRIFFVEVAQLGEFRMAVQRVLVEIDLGVERNYAAVRGYDQRVDFRQRRIGVPESLVQRLHQFTGIGDQLIGYPDLARQGFGFVTAEPGFGIDHDLVNQFRGFLGHGFDFGAALGTGHDHDPLRGAIDDQADIEFIGDVGALFDQQALDQLALGPGLMGHQGHAENRVGVLAHLVETFSQLDAAALAAPARVDLRLDYPFFAADFPGGGNRLVDRETGFAGWYRDAVTTQDILALILMDFHWMPLPFSNFWYIVYQIEPESIRLNPP